MRQSLRCSTNHYGNSFTSLHKPRTLNCYYTCSEISAMLLPLHLNTIQHTNIACHIPHITKTNNCSQTLRNKYSAPFHNGPNKNADCHNLMNKNHNILAFISTAPSEADFPVPTTHSFTATH